MANAHRGESGKSDAEPVDPSEETFYEHDTDPESTDVPEASGDPEASDDHTDPEADQADDTGTESSDRGAKNTADSPVTPVKRTAKKRSARPVTTPPSTASETATKGSAGNKGVGGKKFVPTATAASAGSSGGKSRRQRMADLAEQQKRADRRRRLGLVALCVALGLAVLAWPSYHLIRNNILQATPRADIGVPAAEAGCLPEESNPATGNQEHVPDGTVVPYPRLPPDSGPHYNEWTDLSEKFYTPETRPAVEKLVHNLEHGYTVIWYSTDMPQAEVDALRALANTYSDANPSAKVKAAPWSPTNDGGAFPENTQLVMTRWVADPADPTNVAKQKSVRLACSNVSGEALEQFKEKYPATDAPEPQGG